MKRVITSCLVICLALTWALSALGAPDLYSDRVAASVNGNVILESEVREYRQPFVRKSFSIPLGVVPPGKVPTEKEILDELIVVHLLEQEAEKKGIQINEQGLDASIDSLRKRNNLTPERFVMYLAANGMNYSDFRRLLKRQMILSAVLSREMQQRLKLTEESAQKYFKENKDKIDEQYRELHQVPQEAAPQEEHKLEIPTHKEIQEGGRLHLKQIMLKMPKAQNRQAQAKLMETIKQIYKEHQMGADFAQLARKYSQDSTASEGGDLGTLDYKDMQPGMQKIVQRMHVGGLSDPLPMGGGRGEGGVMIFYLADASNRKTKKVPLTKQERQQVEKEIAAIKKRREEEAKQVEAARNAKQEPPPPLEEKEKPGSDGKKKEEKDLGILTPEEKQEYDKVRGKVIEILKNKNLDAKMHELIEDLKRDAIIETKL